MYRYKEKRWDLKQLIGSGGMPSSHSATVTALATAVGFHEGFGGPLFATALVLACIVWLLFLLNLFIFIFRKGLIFYLDAFVYSELQQNR